MTGLAAHLRIRLGTLDLDMALAVEPGEVVAVLGPNGAGKTTVLRCLAGLAPIDGGRIVLDGTVLDDPAQDEWIPTEHRPIAYVFQDYLLFPHLSALENVAFGLRSRGMAKPNARRRAGEWLDRVGLAAMASSRPAALSGGQAQRVALARALATEPQLLLLDEPLAALDASTRLQLRAELASHLAGSDGMRLIVTHDPVEAMVLADRLVVVEAGRVVQTGTGVDISQHPRSPWVAELVGLNLYRGRAAGQHVRLAGGGELVTASSTAGEVFATVRPEAVALHRLRPEGSPRNVWHGRVRTVESTGSTVRVVVNVDGSGGPSTGMRLVAAVTPAAVVDLGLGAGGEVWVSAKATDVVVYSASVAAERAM